MTLIYIVENHGLGDDGDGDEDGNGCRQLGFENRSFSENVWSEYAFCPKTETLVRLCGQCMWSLVSVCGKCMWSEEGCRVASLRSPNWPLGPVSAACEILEFKTGGAGRGRWEWVGN